MFLISAPHGLGYLIFFLALIILFLPVWCILDILKTDFKGKNSKLVWGLIIIFLPLIGSFMYLSFLRNNRI